MMGGQTTYFPDKDADIVLGAANARERRDGCSYGDGIAGLDKPRAEQVVASCALV